MILFFRQETMVILVHFKRTFRGWGNRKRIWFLTKSLKYKFLHIMVLFLLGRVGLNIYPPLLQGSPDIELPCNKGGRMWFLLYESLESQRRYYPQSQETGISATAYLDHWKQLGAELFRLPSPLLKEQYGGIVLVQKILILVGCSSIVEQLTTAYFQPRSFWCKFKWRLCWRVSHVQHFFLLFSIYKSGSKNGFF